MLRFPLNEWRALYENPAVAYIWVHKGQSRLRIVCCGKRLEVAFQRLVIVRRELS